MTRTAEQQDAFGLRLVRGEGRLHRRPGLRDARAVRLWRGARGRREEGSGGDAGVAGLLLLLPLLLWQPRRKTEERGYPLVLSPSIPPRAR